MKIETLKSNDKDLIREDLNELKNEIEQPGKVTYLRESTDKNYSIYRYQLVQGGTKGGIKKKYVDQIGPWVEGTQFTDAKGNEIKKDRFDAGEIVYLRVPNYIDPTPEMNLDEIMAMTDKEVIDLELAVELYREKYFNHKDKNGLYAIIKGKKVYLCNENHLPNHDGAYIRYRFNMNGEFSLFTKKGNNYKGIRWQEYENRINRGTRVFHNYEDVGVRVG